MQNNWWFFFLSISFDDKFIKADTKVVPPDAPHATQSTSVSVLCPHQAGVRTKEVEKVVSGGATVAAASSAATACASTTLAAAALATASFATTSVATAAFTSPPAPLPPSPPPPPLPPPWRWPRAAARARGGMARAWAHDGERLLNARALRREDGVEDCDRTLSVSGFTVCTDTFTSSLPILRRRSGQHTLLSGHREKNT